MASGRYLENLVFADFQHKNIHSRFCSVITQKMDKTRYFCVPVIVVHYLDKR